MAQLKCVLVHAHTGVVKSVACADNWISIGNQNGAINTLDVRTGELLSLWKPADSANVQVQMKVVFLDDDNAAQYIKLFPIWPLDVF